jgi:hypothetical protein
MNGRTAQRLRALEIDEISLVDRPANQHGLVAIAKRDEGAPMPLFDADGYEVDQDELEVGEYAYDEDGNQFAVVDEHTAAELGIDVDELDDEYADLLDGELVGKAGSDVEPYFRSHPGSSRPNRGGRSYGSRQSNYGDRQPGSRTDRLKGEARSARARGSRYAGNARRALAGTSGRTRAAAAGGGALLAGGGGYASGRRSNTSKSLGDEVYEQLSKSFTDADQLDAISKVADLIDEARDDAADAWRVAKSLADERDDQAYYALARQYDHLPIPPEQLASVLKSASGALSKRDMAVLDRALSAQPVDYDEYGYNGRPDSDVMAQVQALTADTIAKSDTDLSQADLVVGLFDANPALYDEYEAEQRNSLRS